LVGKRRILPTPLTHLEAGFFAVRSEGQNNSGVEISAGDDNMLAFAVLGALLLHPILVKAPLVISRKFGLMTVELNIKWNGQQYQVHLEPEDNVGALKTAMKEKTEVEPARQKFIGLKTRDGKALSDEVLVGDLLIKPTLKIMMMG